MLGETIRRALCLPLFQVYGNESVVIPNAEKSFLDKRTEESLRVYIYEHLGEKMAISTLSELAGMSTNAFLVAFGQTLAQTPARYVIAQRLRRVK